MKKVYMPSDEILSEMELYGGDIYKYLIVKSYELIIIAGSNYYQNDDIDIGRLRMIQNILKKLNNASIELPVATYLSCPKKLMLEATDDNDYMHELIERVLARNDAQIKDLDILAYLKEYSIKNLSIIKLAIDILARKLSKSPIYRFEYEEKDGNNLLLNDIFSTKILDTNIPWDYELMIKLAKIEPAYAVLIKEVLFEGHMLDVTNRKHKQILKNSIDEYAKRYRISFDNEYSHGHDYREKTKKLIKYIKSEKTSLY